MSRPRFLYNYARSSAMYQLLICPVYHKCYYPRQTRNFLYKGHARCFNSPPILLTLFTFTTSLAIIIIIIIIIYVLLCHLVQKPFGVNSIKINTKTIIDTFRDAFKEGVRGFVVQVFKFF